MKTFKVTFYIEGAYAVDYSMTIETSNEAAAIAKIQKLSTKYYNIQVKEIK